MATKKLEIGKCFRFGAEGDAKDYEYELEVVVEAPCGIIMFAREVAAVDSFAGPVHAVETVNMDFSETEE